MIFENEMIAQPAIFAQNLNKCSGKLQAVADLSLKVEQGEIFGLPGSNGAGKTTTLNMICGLLTPDSGSAQILGLNMAKDASRIKARIGVQLQTTSLLPELSALDQIILFGHLNARQEGSRLHMETADVPTTLAALFTAVVAQGYKVRDLVVK